jgi:FMN-dependent NADH-azoreductase
MAHILHIDASPRGGSSHSRTLSQAFMNYWKVANPSDTITYRDLGHNPVPHVDEAWIGGAFMPPTMHTPEMTQAVKISDDLVDEFLAADRYVFGVPMYNLNVPSTFKAYIDQIVRVGRTFAVDANGYKGLVEGKKMIFITARGSDFRAEFLAPYDFQEPYLRSIFGFIGVTDVQFIHANALNQDDAVRDQVLGEAHAAIKDAVVAW